MSRQLTPNPLAWQNRWEEPTLEDLLAPLKSHHRRVFEKLGEQVTALQPMQQAIAWYGTGWHWTIEYHQINGKGRQTRSGNGSSNGNGHGTAANQALCYLVPRLESPLVCIPLSDEAMEELPVRRLSKFVRDGVKLAKYAVQTHWATWSPNNQSEAEQLVDLLKRKHKIMSDLADTKRKG